MKKTINLIRKFMALADGQTLASSSLRGDWIDQMLADGVIHRLSHGRNTSYKASDREAFLAYIAVHYDLRDLPAALRLMEGEAQGLRSAAADPSVSVSPAALDDAGRSIAQHADATSRAAQVAATGNSKFVSRRTMTGFLVNSYEDIAATMHGRPIVIHPAPGTFTFISDYRAFAIPPNVTIVGMENAENFRQIERQRYLFAHLSPVLFVSRYPQNGDLVRWLQTINNPYIHFGDFDLAGIHIFLSEFYAKLGPERSQFFIPDDITRRLPLGSMERYEKQFARYATRPIADPRLEPLVALIHRHHRGYDQEGYIE